MVQGVKYVFDVKPPAVSREVVWNLKNAAKDREVIQSAVGALQRHGAAVLRQEDFQSAVYFGSRADARMHGLWKNDVLQMPTRVLLLAYDGDDSIMLRVRCDQDYGFQLFMGGVKRRFKERYAEAFARIIQLLQEELSSRYELQQVQWIAGARR